MKNIHKIASSWNSGYRVSLFRLAVVVAAVATMLAGYGLASGRTDALAAITPASSDGTLTPGYWKTHNETFPGGASATSTWELVGPDKEQEDFLNSDPSWYEVLWAPDAGNPWNKLARHYAAASLNVLAGADDEDLLRIVIDLDGFDGGLATTTIDILVEAKAWLEGTTVAEGALAAEILAYMAEKERAGEFAGSFPTRKELRATGEWSGKQIARFLNASRPMLILAEYLDAYNNGDSFWQDLDDNGVINVPPDVFDPQVGPGHVID